MSKIIICEDCAGFGKVEHDTSEGRERESEIIDCKECKGSGRLLIKTVTTAKAFCYDYKSHRFDIKKH